ncbi:MAG: DUF4446 family protein [Ardenticatenales bacterium]
MPLAIHALFHAALALAALLQSGTPNPSPSTPPSTATTPAASATPARVPSTTSIAATTAVATTAVATTGAATTGAQSTSAITPTTRAATLIAPSATVTATPAPTRIAPPLAGVIASPPASGATGPRAPAWLAPLGRLDPSVLAAIALAALALALITLGFAIVTWVRARRMTRHYTSLMRGVEGQNLARAVESYVERLNAVERRSGQVGEHGRATSTRLNAAIQHVQLERFSAVDASDNHQSFSLALLDAADNGIVLSAIYTRSGLRLYAKPIAGGHSTYALTPEERRAIGGDAQG